MGRQTVIIGARGFIGSALMRRLNSAGISAVGLGRGESLPALAGDVYYCAGLTADFRTRPHETIDAHVSFLSNVLRKIDFDSFTYLSSTRVYQKVKTGSEETPLVVDPMDPGEIYNLTKLTGEAACLLDSRQSARVVRLSNVFGEGNTGKNFLDTIVLEARQHGRVHIYNGALAAKDYISIEDAVEALLRVPVYAKSRILNVASGEIVTNERVGNLLRHLLSIEVSYGLNQFGTVFPEIDTRRMRDELKIEPQIFEAAFRSWIGP